MGYLFLGEKIMISKKYICNNKDVLLTMNEFFNKLPREYGNNYYANLAGVKIKYVKVKK